MCEKRMRVIDVLAAHGGFAAWVRSHIDENCSTNNSADGRTRTANLSVMNAPL